jgi:hypothetical protein
MVDQSRRPAGKMDERPQGHHCLRWVLPAPAATDAKPFPSFPPLARSPLHHDLPHSPKRKEAVVFGCGGAAEDGWLQPPVPHAPRPDPGSPRTTRHVHRAHNQPLNRLQPSNHPNQLPDKTCRRDLQTRPAAAAAAGKQIQPSPLHGTHWCSS